MENTNKRNPWYLVAGIACIIVGAIMLFLVCKTISDSIDEMNAKTEEFYEPYWINDSTMHMNISEGSCILVQFVDDECYVTANNIEYVNISDGILKIMYHENKEFKAAEFNLDSITNRDCSNAVF